MTRNAAATSHAVPKACRALLADYHPGSYLTYHRFLPHTNTADLRTRQECVVRSRNARKCRQHDEAGQDCVASSLRQALRVDLPKSRCEVQKSGADDAPTDHERSATSDVKKDQTDAAPDDADQLTEDTVGERVCAEALLDVERRCIGLHELVAVGLLEYEEGCADLLYPSQQI